MSTQPGVSVIVKIRYTRRSGHKFDVNTLKYKGLRKIKLQRKKLDVAGNGFSEKYGHTGVRVYDSWQQKPCT